MTSRRVLNPKSYFLNSKIALSADEPSWWDQRSFSKLTIGASEVVLNCSLEGGGTPPLLNLNPILNVFVSRIMMGTPDEHGESISVHISSCSLSHPPHRILHKELRRNLTFMSIMLISYFPMVSEHRRDPVPAYKASTSILGHIDNQILTKHVMDRYGNYPV